MPDGVADRKAEVWRSLLAIADEAGGDWPKRARAACEHFALGAQAGGGASFGVRLLADLKAIFGDRDRMPTVEILETLCQIEEAPWGDIRGRALDARGLARYLKKYDVIPATFKLQDGTGGTAKGYTTYPTKDNPAWPTCWQRYLPSSGRNGNHGNSGNPAGGDSEDSYPVTDGSVTGQLGNNALTCEVTEVTEVTEKPGACSRHVRYGPHPHCPDCGALRHRQASTLAGLPEDRRRHRPAGLVLLVRPLGLHHGDGYGHREAHCHNDESPYSDTGYYLASPAAIDRCRK